MSKKETKTMKVIVLTVGEKSKVVKLPVKHDYRDLKRLINIESPITVVQRKIGNKYFDIWCDDEGLLKDNLATTAFNSPASTSGLQEVLCGNILIANHDEDGNTTGLSDNDIKLIQDSLIVYSEHRDYTIFSNFGNISIKQNTEVLTYTF